MVTTKIETVPVGGGEPIAELPAEIILYGERLNAYGPVNFALSADHPTCNRSTVAAMEHEIVVTRNQQQVWSGPVLTMDERTQGKQATIISFGGEGLAHYLKRMHVTSTVGQQAAYDQFSIVKDLVDHHQNKAGGNFGIDTSNITTSGVAREGLIYKGFELKNIAEAVEQLANRENGFDFSVHPETRELELWYPRKGARKNELVWDERTIESFVRREDGTAQASQVLGAGEGLGSKKLRRNLQDAAAVAAHKLTQAVYRNEEVSVAQTLEDHVRRQLALFSNVPATIGITVQTNEPGVFSYEVGDEGVVRWNSPYDPVNRVMKLVGRDIVWIRGRELAVLYLEDVIAL